MRTVNVSWDVPAVREDGKALPITEILDTEVLIAAVADNGTVGNFTSLAKVKPDATQTVTHPVPDGNYKLRFIVTDTFGKKGKPLDASVTVVSAPPGQVTNVKVTIE